MIDTIYFDKILCLACDSISDIPQGENTCPNCLTTGMNVWAEREEN